MKPSDVDMSRLPWLKMANPEQPFYPLDPRPEEVCITNIAWALSMQCRFNGHVTSFYSVAQHSVIVSRIVESGHPFDNELILRALMHDAHEAYCGDLVTPIKRELPRFKEIEDALDKAICERFNMELEMDSCIKEADTIALVTEARDLQQTPFLDDIFKDIKPLDMVIEPVGQAEAYKMFMNRFENLQERIRFNKFQKEKSKSKAVA